MDLRGYKAVEERREALEKSLKVSLKNIGSFILDETTTSKRNCENMVGAAQIPLGIAGPLRLRSGSLTPKEYFVPLATTEGALVASVSRGCKAITLSGGASVFTNKVGATRGPVFETKSLRQSFEFSDWLGKHLGDIKRESVKAQDHLRLVKITPKVIGTKVFVRFEFDTDLAMGMNMVTLATGEMAKFIEKKTGIKCLSLSGNWCVDKKPAWLNFIRGRGFEVWADVILKEKVLREVLKTSAKKFFDVWLGKCMIGSAVSGSMGFNAHFANSIAAVFAATGQDLAHTVEGSLGITTAEVRGKDLYVSVYLPDLMLGVVGGGTGLATQKEALGVLGVKSSGELAEVIGGAVLAGEISLLASLSEGSLVKAHEEHRHS